MEQQTVTIAKAGIHASLNARCSVLAAANPVYGQYDRRRRIQENIGLPDSLLSRFDLLFVVLDQIDPESDRRIATHVIRGHRYRSDHGQAGHDSDYDDDDSDDEDYDESEQSKVHSVWQRNRHQMQNAEDDNDPHSGDVLQHEFLRKYMHFAKTRIKPVLTEAARDFIANRYAEMRARQDERTLPITARSLETVIRLATAHAKCRLSETVEAEPDCEVAMDILSFALYHENSHNISNEAKATADSSQKRAVVSDAGESDDDVERSSSPKRARVDEESLQTRIWHALNENDGMMDADEIEGDKESIQAALKSMTESGRIMVDEDGFVHMIE